LAYAGKLAITTAKLGGLFLAILISVYAASVGSDLLVGGNFHHINLLLTPSGIIATTILATGYFFLRLLFIKRFAKKTDYGFAARFLHHLALGIPGVAEASFNLNCAVNRSSNDVLYKRHVFIAGLARAGTTVLMQAFHNTGNFRSLTYRDMPFVLMPNIWKSMSSPFKREKALEERAHGDRVMVNFDSPEALEEVFWRTFCGDDYILDKYLKPHDVNDEIINRFRRYVSLIILSADDERKHSYLSKNNSNILRLSSIQKAFPNALMLIPFRDPIQQAISLKRQHEKFCERHGHDRFSFRYMSWLGHHEFGLTHKHFMFNETMVEDIDRWSTNDIHYWINLWTNVYSYILNQRMDNMLFVSYKDLCDKSVVVLSGLFRAANLKLKLKEEDINFSESITAIPERLNDNIMERATNIYTALQEEAR